MRAATAPARPAGAVATSAAAPSLAISAAPRPPLPARLAAAAAAALITLGGASPALAAMRLPPIDTDPNRCERAFTGNTIGQANAVSDKVLDLRACKLPGAKLDGKTLAGALMSEGSFERASMVETVLSKAYARGASFKGANMTNGVLDRVDWTGADLSGVNFTNAVITGGIGLETATFDAATVFEDALIGNEDAKKLCLNPTLRGVPRSQVGCRGG